MDLIQIFLHIMPRRSGSTGTSTSDESIWLQNPFTNFHRSDEFNPAIQKSDPQSSSTSHVARCILRREVRILLHFGFDQSGSVIAGMLSRFRIISWTQLGPGVHCILTRRLHSRFWEDRRYPQQPGIKKLNLYLSFFLSFCFKLIILNWHPRIGVS